ncbi:MAG: phage integrase N-terminal SAM-like domain-containing protein [Candidatus Limnocylindria bacterium]
MADPDALANLAYTRHLRAENNAPSTTVTYAKAVGPFDAFLAEPRRRRPRRVADVRREDVEAFLVDRAEAGMRPAPLSQRFRSLQQFLKWLADEGEIERSPMATMRPPHVPEFPHRSCAKTISAGCSRPAAAPRSRIGAIATHRHQWPLLATLAIRRRLRCAPRRFRRGRTDRRRRTGGRSPPR